MLGPMTRTEIRRQASQLDRIEHVITWEEQRGVTENLTPHYKRER